MTSDAQGAAQPEAEANPIQYDLESADVYKRIAHVTVDVAHLERRRADVARQLAAKANLPGFRKGKVPAKVIRSRFGGQVEQEALESLIPDAYRHVIEHEDDLHPISEPRVENLRLEEGEPLGFDLVMEVRPDVEIQGLDALEVEETRAPITDARVEQALAELAERHAEWVTVERGADQGDAMRISYVPLNEDDSPDEENRNDSYSLELGADGVLPEFNAALVGLEVDDETEVEVSYPEDYPREDLRGQTMRFSVKVLDIREKRIPELSDEFASEKTASGSLEELRASLREELEKAAVAESGRRLDEALVDGLLERNELPVPPSLEARYLQAFAEDYQQMTGQQLQGDQRQEFADSFRERARRAARRTILLDNLRRQQSIEVSEEDLKARIAELAAERDMDPAEYEQAVRSADNMDRLRSDLEERRILDFVRDGAKVTVVEKEPEGSGDGKDSSESKTEE